jgi:hypothetical protein
MAAKKILDLIIDYNNVDIKIYTDINIAIPYYTKTTPPKLFKQVIVPIDYIDRIYIEHTEYFLVFKLNSLTQILVEEDRPGGSILRHCIDNKIELPIYDPSIGYNTLKFFDNTIGLKNIPTELKQLFVETL